MRDTFTVATLEVPKAERVVTMTETELGLMLHEAASAHHLHEKNLGHPDDQWPEWYAAYIMDRRGGQE